MSDKKQKVKVEKNIFQKQKGSKFTWKDLKDIQFEDDDVISVEYVESFYSENNSWDGHFMASVIRMVEETDEQFEKRIEFGKRSAKLHKENRYKNYLKLKEEFENEQS